MIAIVLAMDIAQILSAGITGGLALIGVIWQARKTRWLNSEEHRINANKLESIETKVDHVHYMIERIEDQVDDTNERLDEHFRWHGGTSWWKKKQLK